MKKFSKILCLALVLAIMAGFSGIAYADDSVNFVYGIDSDIDDFNPMNNQMTNYVCTFVFNVYEPLMHLNGDMEYTMDLATAYEQVDDLTRKNANQATQITTLQRENASLKSQVNSYKPDAERWRRQLEVNR